MESEGPVFSQTTLRRCAKLIGHKDTVLCMDNTHQIGNLLCSGSEDGTLRLWDLKTVNRGEPYSELRAIRSLVVPSKEAVTGVALRHLEEKKNRKAPVKPAGTFDSHEEYQVYVAAESQLFRFSLEGTSIVLRDPYIVHPYNTEEINQVSICHGYLAACDDSGQVKVLDIEQGEKAPKLYKTLTGQHTNICSSAVFRSGKNSEVITCGQDCRVVIWDVSTTRAVATFDTNKSVKVEENQGKFQMVNPPLAHCVAVSPEGNAAAVALADCSISIYHIPTKKQLEELKEFHTAGVCQVLFYRSSSDDATYLVSGGNDGKINVWRVPASHILHPRPKATVTENCIHIASVSHGSKINWLTFSKRSGLLCCAHGLGANDGNPFGGAMCQGGLERKEGEVDLHSFPTQDASMEISRLLCQESQGPTSSIQNGSNGPASISEQRENIIREDAPLSVEMKPVRRCFSAKQKEELYRLFIRSPYPTLEERVQVARRFYTTERRVQIWFQNQRSRLEPSCVQKVTCHRVQRRVEGFEVVLSKKVSHLET
ncbi:hypothetical protein PROFUN_00342 [Planoprotostelium fungivorum]|uniref:Homeobox domain-containing protein n=1 Tax=Planoprotostelium fungivorum TaxID=1890364 RepID=A0A2P6NY37_9EUKA|nr:hypothetical protein PROFUN_00342 [Planoprotostelium fungivorum]